MSGAARVLVTLDELADLLELPDGHRLEAVEELPDGYRLGLALTIVSAREGTALPVHNLLEPLYQVNLATYRNWNSQQGARPLTMRSTLTEIEHPAGTVALHPLLRERPPEAIPAEYQPARAPLVPARTVRRPTFPGEDLTYTGEPEEDDHLGGPR